MKKTLAIICAVAVLVSALAGTFLFASANDPAATLVTLPTYVDGEGNPLTLVGGEASIPTSVVTSSAVKSVANTSSIPFPNLFEITKETQDAGSNFFMYITPAAGKGAIFYVDAPTSEGSEFRFVPYAINEDNKGSYQYGLYGSDMFYTLADGDTAWTGVDISGYGIDINGFKGYVYVPFVALTGGTPITNGVKCKGFQFWIKEGTTKIAAGDSFYLSAPMIVNGDVDASRTEVALPSAEKVTDGTNEYEYFAAPVKEPVYDSIPKDVSIAEVAELKSQLAYGMGKDDIPVTTINKDVANASGFDYTIVAPVGISGRPAIKVTGGTGAADAELGLPTIYFADNKKPATALMFYIDSTDAERKYFPTLGTKDANGADQYTLTYNGKVWIMADGATEWTEIPISQYYFTLPAGFKGSVKIDYTNASFLYGPVVTGVHQLGLKTVGPIADGDAIVIGNPVHITRDCFNNKFILGSIVDANSNNVIGNVDGVVDIPVVTPPAEEEEPEFLEGATEIFAPKGDLTIGSSTGTVTEIESICPVTDNKSAKVTGYTSGTVAQFQFNDKADKAIGVIVYLKTSTPNPEFKIATGAWVYGAEGVEDGTYKWPSTSYMYGQMYYLAKGATKWEQTTAASQTYHRQIPAPNGFEGYIYFPFNSSVAYNVKCESAIVEYVYLQMLANTGDVEMSSWMNVKSFNEATVYATIGTEKCIDMLTGAAYTSGNQGGTTPPPSGGGEGGEGGETPDPNPGGGEGGETPEVQPDYKLPAYTGEAIDYTDLSIQKVTVAKLKGVVTVGGDLTDSGASTTKGGTITAVESRNKLTNYPSFKVNVTTGEVVAGLCPVAASFYFDTKVAPINPDEILYYVEHNSSTPLTASISWNFYNAQGAYYNIMYSGTLSMLKEGEDKWSEVKVSTYQFQIPANFKGYIKVMVKNIGNQANSPAGGGKDTFVNDTTKWLNNTTIGINNLTPDIDFYASTPLLVTKGGSIPYAAFVDGEENAARNIFTGAVLTRDDLKDFLGVEGSENLNPDKAPVIDYKIPAYTGSQETYGNYLFARIRQMVLADNIAKGYIIPQTTFEDGHADKNNDYTKLVDSLVGISKMPFFSITKSTGNPSENNVVVGTWHPKKAEQANAKAGAVLQYIKLPSDLEKPFVAVYMNCYDANFIAQNIAPYSGTVYFMPKGTNEWQTAKITAYWFELPKGFEGYVMWDTKILKAQNGGTEWGADWTPYNWSLRIANLKEQTVVASAPFWADSIGDIDYACYLNDETKAVRDIFTGKILKKDDIIKPLNIGDTIVKLPDYTTEFSVGFVDEAALSNGTLMLEWDAIDNAAKYTVRVFKKTNTDDGIAYTLFMAEDTTETTITMEGLDLNTQYAIVVYAYNAKNDEIAVFDYLNASTAAGAAPVAPVKPTTPGATNKKPAAVEEEETGLSQTTIILIVVGAAVLVLAIAAVVTILLIKKRRTRANV